MEKSYELVHSVSAKISVGDFENICPMYSMKQIVKVEEGETLNISKVYDEMKEILKSKISRDIDIAAKNKS